jgi:peptidoglycan/xylan/chitin deacetylase (PgdA/CDA1 family)
MFDSSMRASVTGSSAEFQAAGSPAAQPIAPAPERAENRRSAKGRAGRSPAVSVVVPAYNAAATLTATLNSLRRQTLRDFEAIVVDDGSADDTFQIAQAIAAADGRFRAVSKPNGGVSSAYNRGLREASGAWVLFLDSDDLLRRRALERLLAAARATPGAGVAVGAAARMDGRGRVWRSPRFDLSEPFARLAYECAIPAIHSAMVRRELALEIGGFDESLRTSEDWDFWQRLARTGAAFAQIDDEVALYRSQPGSLSKNIAQLVSDTFQVIERGGRADPRVPNAAPAYAEGAPAELQGRYRLNFLLWSAARQVAAGGDGAELFDVLRSRLDLDLDLDPEEVGEMLAEGMADFLALQPDELGGRWPAFAPELKAMLAQAFPGADRARLRDVVLLTLKNRFHVPFDGADAQAVGEVRLQHGGELIDDAATPAAVQLSRNGPVGMVVRTGLQPKDAAALAHSFAGQLSGLAMSDAADARPWLRAGFWPPFLARGAEGLALAAGALLMRGGAPAGFGRHRLRYAFAGGLAGALGLEPARPGAPRVAARRTGRPSGGEGLVCQAPILMYHRVAPAGPEALRRWRVHPDAFRRQVELLARNGAWTPTAAQLDAALTFNRPLDAGAVMFTFDDGYADFAEHAWPILQEHGFTAQVFVVAGKVGGRADWDAAMGEAAPLMDWATLRRLAQEGVEIGSHSLTHAKLTRLSVAQAHREAKASFDLIAAEIGQAPRTFAYPFGLRDPFVQQVVADCGYRLGFSCIGGAATLSSPALKLPRIEAYGDDLEVFARKLGLRAGR